MRRLQRHIIATASCGLCSISSTPIFLFCFREDSSDCVSRYRHHCSARERDRPLRNTSRSYATPPGCPGCAAAEACGLEASGAATADVDVTVTCSSLMSELQRVFPWSAAYCLWQQRHRWTSAPPASSAVSSTAAQDGDCVSSKTLTTDEGYDWRDLFLVRYEPHPALLSVTPAIQKDSAEEGRTDSARAAESAVAGRGGSGRRRRSGSGRRSQADIRGNPLNAAATATAESTCGTRAVQLWREVLLSSSSYMAGSCPAQESQVGGSSHAVPKDAADVSMAGRRCDNEGTRTPAASTMGISATLGTGGGAVTKQSAAPSKTLAEVPLPPSIFAWSTPPTYELYHLSEYVNHPRGGAASHARSSPPQATEATATSLGQRHRRSSIVRRLRRVGRLHAIPGLPQLPPLLLSRQREMSSGETLDGAVRCSENTWEHSARVTQADENEAGTLQVMTIAEKGYGIESDEDTSVEQEDLLGGTVCSLHDYGHFLSGGCHLEEGKAADGVDREEHPLPPKGRLTTDSPASSNRGAHVFHPASERVCSAAAVSHFISSDAAAAASSPLPAPSAATAATAWRFAPPLSEGAGRTGGGVGLSNGSERWRVLTDGGNGKAGLSGLYQQRRKPCAEEEAATACIRPREIYENNGHNNWNRIEYGVFMDEMTRVRCRYHRPSSTTAAAASVPFRVSRQRAHAAAPVPKRQQEAARTRHERAALTTAARVPPLSSAPCAAPSLMMTDTLETGYSREALSASHGVGVLLAHQHEWISFSVLFHAHAAQLPGTSTESAPGLAPDRSLDLSHFYCFLHPPCRLSTEELEEWARGARKQRRECERMHKRGCDHRRHPDGRSETEEEVSDRSQHGSQSLLLTHCMAARAHRSVPRLGRGTESSRCTKPIASEPSAPWTASAAPRMPSPRTWLVYVHPDVSLHTLPQLWTCAFGEDAPSSVISGAEKTRGARNTTWKADGRSEVDGGSEEGVGSGGCDDETGHEYAAPPYFHAAVAHRRRRQAGEVEMLWRYLLLSTLPLNNASAALCGHQSQVSVRSPANSRGRLIAEASNKAATEVTFPMPPTAPSPASAAEPQRLPASAAASPQEEHRQSQLRALECTLTVSPLPRSTDLLKQRHWLAKPFVLAEEMKYGRVVKYSRAELAVPRVL